MQQFLIDYGLLAVFPCAVIENDVTFILTGVIIHLGIVSPVPAIAAGVSGALVHDSIWFWIGHSRSEKIRGSRTYRRIGPAVERLAERFGPGELFLCRFIYGTRTPSLIFWGVQRLAYVKFLFIEAFALATWGSILTGLGYFLSDRAATVIGKVRSLERYLLATVILAFLVFVGARLFTRHEIKKRLELRPPESDKDEKDHPE